MEISPSTNFLPIRERCTAVRRVRRGCSGRSCNSHWALTRRCLTPRSKAAVSPAPSLAPFRSARFRIWRPHSSCDRVCRRHSSRSCTRSLFRTCCNSAGWRVVLRLLGSGSRSRSWAFLSARCSALRCQMRTRRFRRCTPSRSFSSPSSSPSRRCARSHSTRTAFGESLRRAYLPSHFLPPARWRTFPPSRCAQSCSHSSSGAAH
mmetsp:Transcript_14492/g.36712  ORF Transcript_14492/g.36712 Transcript_14492/m.36712 type:complete len:205 (+) Transcript_14492:788-1402(+)